MLANVLYEVIKGEPLIRAMISGRKPAGDYADQHPPAALERPFERAGTLLAVSAAAVLGLVILIAGKL